MPGPRTKRKSFCSLALWMTAPLVAWGQGATLPVPPQDSLAQISSEGRNARDDLDSCRIYQVKDLPGSHHFASDFIEAVATDPNPRAKDQHILWALTADLSDEVPANDRALYISKSINDGVTWTELARLDSRYFNAEMGEGLRNGLGVSSGGSEFVVTTQLGAFQVFPQRNISEPIVKPIVGPRVPSGPPKISIPKKPGDPVRAGVVKLTADGRHMILSYGYFDLDPQIYTYHKDSRGSWIEDGHLPPIPTEMDIFSMGFDNPKKIRPGSLYVGTGDQAYRFDLRTKRWSLVTGVGPDSAIHSMSTRGGLHFAACWAIYTPLNADAVTRVTYPRFLLHRWADEVGPNIRTYGIDVDPVTSSRIVVGTLTGVYITDDGGQRWTRINDLPDGEFYFVHFNPDETILVSGVVGTFLANPYSSACSPHLKRRAR